MHTVSVYFFHNMYQHYTNTYYENSPDLFAVLEAVYIIKHFEKRLLPMS